MIYVFSLDLDLKVGLSIHLVRYVMHIRTITKGSGEAL